MPPFRAVGFDLFDTLVDFDQGLFPVVEIDGKPEKTTSRAAFEALEGAGAVLPAYEAFHALWLENTEEVWSARNRDSELREISSIDRFTLLMEKIDTIPAGEREAAVRVAVEAHMQALTASAVFPPERLGLLERIQKASLPIGLLSNFDHAPAARGLLERTGIAPFLDVVLISEEAGYRKPAPRLFRSLAEGLGAAPGEILFVGDDFEADVVGARGAGIRSAWLNPKGHPVPEKSPPPDFEIRRLEEVIGILEL
ncbi:MAG: HAD family hydrolase [bacterium]|nr:HAD family hydrolase [bacterium]